MAGGPGNSVLSGSSSLPTGNFWNPLNASFSSQHILPLVVFLRYPHFYEKTLTFSKISQLFQMPESPNKESRFWSPRNVTPTSTCLFPLLSHCTSYGWCDGTVFLSTVWKHFQYYLIETLLSLSVYLSHFILAPICHCTYYKLSEVIFLHSLLIITTIFSILYKAGKTINIHWLKNWMPGWKEWATLLCDHGIFLSSIIYPSL